MLFSDRLLFLHVPKAGGTSIVRHLMDVLPKPVHYSLPPGHDADIPPGVIRFDGIAHESLEEARLVLARRGRRLEDFPVVVACIRNPYELEVSRYSFLRSDLNGYNHGPPQAVALLGDFELFAMCTRPHGRRPLEMYFTLEGVVPSNLRIARLEQVEADLARFLAEAGIDARTAGIAHHNRSEHDPFRSYYTPAAEQAVYDKYKWVFDSGLYPRLRPSRASGPPSATVFAAPEEVDRLVASRLAHLDRRQDDFDRANIWLAAAEIHRLRLRSREQEDALERALAHALRVGSDRLASRIADELARARSLGGRGTVDEGVARCAALGEITRGAWASGGARLLLAELLAAAERFDEARAICDEVSRAKPELALGAASHGGCVELLAGDAEAAEASFQRGWWNHQGLAADRAEALYRLGRYEDARRLADFTAATAPAGDARSQARWRRMRAKLLATAGDAAAATELAREAVAIVARCDAPNHHADALVDLAEVFHLGGRGNESRSALDEALRLYERKGNVASARRTAELLTGAEASASSRRALTRRDRGRF